MDIIEDARHAHAESASLNSIRVTWGDPSTKKREGRAVRGALHELVLGAWHRAVGSARHRRSPAAYYGGPHGYLVRTALQPVRQTACRCAPPCADCCAESPQRLLLRTCNCRDRPRRQVVLGEDQRGHRSECVDTRRESADVALRRLEPRLARPPGVVHAEPSLAATTVNSGNVHRGGCHWFPR